MKLEDIYKELSIFDFMSAFYRIGNSYLSKRQESYGLGYGQHQFLLALYRENGLSQDELSKRISVDKITTQRGVAKLKELGYVSISIDAKDERIHHVMLTPEAMNIKDEILSIANDWELLLLDKLSEQDKADLLQLYKRIVSSEHQRDCIT